VLRKDDDDWVKKCMEHEVEGSRPRGRPKKTWKEVVCEDCQARKLNRGCHVPDQRPLNGRSCCCCCLSENVKYSSVEQC